MGIGKIAKIICMFMMLILLTGCIGEKSYYSLNSNETIETETVDDGETSTVEDEPMPEKYSDYDYSYVNHDYSFSSYSFADKYTTAIGAAIDSGNFSLVEPCLKRNSTLYKALKTRVEKLSSEGTKEYVLSYAVEDIDWETEKKGVLILYEKVDTVSSSGKSSITEVTYEYTIEYVDGRYVLSDRIKHKED